MAFIAFMRADLQFLTFARNILWHSSRNFHLTQYPRIEPMIAHSLGPVLRGTATSAVSVGAIVHLVDDDLTLLKMMQALIGTIGVQVKPFVSAKDFLAGYRPTPCECLVCDLRMPDIDGLELQSRLLSMDLAPPIIFLTGFAEVGIAVEAMKRGAFDFLEKPVSANVLLGKVQAALEISRLRYAEWLRKQAVDARMALLTSRERSIARYVLEGKSSREIAGLLELSVRTVENHRTRIMEKLHVNSTVELVKLFP